LGQDKTRCSPKPADRSRLSPYGTWPGGEKQAQPEGAAPSGLTSAVCEEGRRRLKAPEALAKGAQRRRRKTKPDRGRGTGWTEQRSWRGGKTAPKSAGGPRQRRATPAAKNKHSRRARRRLD